MLEIQGVANFCKAACGGAPTDNVLEGVQKMPRVWQQ